MLRSGESLEIVPVRLAEEARITAMSFAKSVSPLPVDSFRGLCVLFAHVWLQLAQSHCSQNLEELVEFVKPTMVYRTLN